MSLIEEALRRAQDPVTASPQTTTTPPPQQAKPETNPPAHSWTAPAQPHVPPSSGARLRFPTRTAIMLGALGALVVVGLGRIFWWGRTIGLGQTALGSRLLAPGPDTMPAGTPPTSPLQRTHPALASTRAQAHLLLNGVVEGLGEPYAMINGTILGVGEQVGELTLIAINDGAVTLRRADGTETTLHVEH